MLYLDSDFGEPEDKKIFNAFINIMNNKVLLLSGSEFGDLLVWG